MNINMSLDIDGWLYDLLVDGPLLPKHVRDTLENAENATVGMAKLLIFHDLKSAPPNFSDGVSRFRQSWLEVEMAVLPTDVGSGGG